METDSILRSLNYAAVSKDGIPNTLLLAIDEALKERDELRAQLDDFNETYAAVMAEKCAGDEAHCTCVPFLRMENKRLGNILSQGRELLELRTAQRFEAIAHLRAIVDVTLGYAETADAIIEAERWLREMNAKATP